MKTIKFGLVTIILASFLGWVPKSALARTSFYLSIGHHCSGFYPGYYPHYGWHGDHWRWRDRGWYGRPDGGWCAGFHYSGRRHCCWPHHGPCWTSGATFWVEGYYPAVIVERDVVVKKPVREYTTKFDEKTLQLNKQLQNKKSELMERLKLADKEGRKKAIAELAGFSFDKKVKKALGDILLSDPDPELRKEAAKSFAKVRNRDAIAVLEKMRVEDSDEGVRQEADKAIKDIRGY